MFELEFVREMENWNDLLEPDKKKIFGLDPVQLLIYIMSETNGPASETALFSPALYHLSAYFIHLNKGQL